MSGFQGALSGNEIVQLNAPHGATPVSQLATLANTGTVAAGTTFTNAGTIVNTSGTVSGGTLAGAITNGGTITGGTLLPAAETVGSFAVNTLPNFGSITPAGTAVANAAVIAAVTTQLGTAASTTGAVLPAASTVTIGNPLLIINSGTAAVHIYGNGTDHIDTIAGSTGVTLTNGFGVNCIAVTGSTWVTSNKGTIAS